MKMIATIYSCKDLDVTIQIQNRNEKDKKTDSKEPLIERYTSRIGNASLIFNPNVALVLKCNGNYNLSAYIPERLFYRFTSLLHSVYQTLNDEKLFIVDGQNTYVDRNRQVELTRRLSLFQSALQIAPGLVTTYSGSVYRGVEFLVDKNSIGTVPHNEVLGILEQLEHLDIVNFSLISGLANEMVAVNEKLDQILEKLSEPQRVQQPMPRASDQTTITIPESNRPGGLEWDPVRSDWRVL